MRVGGMIEKVAHDRQGVRLLQAGGLGAYFLNDMVGVHEGREPPRGTAAHHELGRVPEAEGIQGHLQGGVKVPQPAEHELGHRAAPR